MLERIRELYWAKPFQPFINTTALYQLTPPDRDFI